MSFVPKTNEPIWFARRFGCPLPSSLSLNRKQCAFDHQTLRLLVGMYDCLESDAQTDDEEEEGAQPVANSLYSPLLQFRTQLRSCRNAKCGRGMLIYIIANTTNKKMRVLSIWLRGWYRRTLGTLDIVEALPDLDASERRAAVRTLRRLSAWPQLCHLATHDPDSRVRRLAKITAPLDHKERLRKFLDQVEEQEVSKSPQSDLFVADNVDFSWRCEAKPGWFIRSVLERIRRMLAA